MNWLLLFWEIYENWVARLFPLICVCYPLQFLVSVTAADDFCHDLSSQTWYWPATLQPRTSFLMKAASVSLRSAGELRVSF